MPAFPRTSPDPKIQAQYDADEAAEAAWWAKAFASAEPDPLAGPLTAEENEQVRDLMVRAKLDGDDALVDQIAALAKDPPAYRRFVERAAAAE